MRRRTFTAGAAAAAVAACAQRPVEPEGVLEPNPNLVVQGIPPIPLSLVRRVEQYTDFAGHLFVDWHPARREMLVAHRLPGASVPQLHRLAGPMAALETLTFDTEPVTFARYDPEAGRYIVFARSRGGNEAAQLYRLDPGQREGVLLTNPDERHAFVGWLPGRGRLVHSAVPLDRTAQGGRRAEITTTLWELDPLAPDARRRIAELPGGGWFGDAVAPDGRTIALTRYVSAAESEVWLIDVASGQRRRLLPAEGGAKAAHFAGGFSADGQALFFTTDRDGEFMGLNRLDLASGRSTRLLPGLNWDVGNVAVSEDGRHVVAQANVDGRDELRLLDGATLAERPLPALPEGSIGSADFHRRQPVLALSTASARGPSQLHALDLASGRVETWTRPRSHPAVDLSRFGEQQVIRWPSFDGRTISGLMTRPPARFTGRRPVVIDIHGGPESQARIGFAGRDSYLVQELGVVLIEPNVRGSRGFGKTFLTLDDGMKREDSVKDIGALLDWIATRPDLDAGRVMVMGGSYGGYMSLAVSVHYADRIAGAVDDVGISHFVTFLQNTESYRRDLRRVEYGDERDPAMREFLHRISPLTNAHRITKPLFVVQGKNDPRVPYTEAEQIVAKARANGNPVWYLRADNEGHGFARKENADFRFYAVVMFARQVLRL